MGTRAALGPCRQDRIVEAVTKVKKVTVVVAGAGIGVEAGPCEVELAGGLGGCVERRQGR